MTQTRPVKRAILQPLRRAIAVLASIGAAASCGGDDDSPGMPSGGGADTDAAEAAPDSALPDARDGSDDASPADAPDASEDAAESAPDGPGSPCPDDMALVGDACVDLYEAPNHEGAVPLVMYSLIEADAWCTARGKRLCYDDEWQAACEGPQATAYPYGNDHQPGVCNDDKIWRTYNQSLLNGWPGSASGPDIESLADLLGAARAVSPTAAAAADHVESLYQGEPGGDNPGCAGVDGVYDLCGNVEEWTLRRDGGEPDFHGNLKGRYWAESRTCQSNVTVHGDYFRFYEIGFRCCRDPL